MPGPACRVHSHKDLSHSCFSLSLEVPGLSPWVGTQATAKGRDTIGLLFELKVTERAEGPRADSQLHLPALRAPGRRHFLLARVSSRSLPLSIGVSLPLLLALLHFSGPCLPCRVPNQKLQGLIVFYAFFLEVLLSYIKDSDPFGMFLYMVQVINKNMIF